MIDFQSFVFRVLFFKLKFTNSFCASKRFFARSQYRCTASGQIKNSTPFPEREAGLCILRVRANGGAMFK